MMRKKINQRDFINVQRHSFQTYLQENEITFQIKELPSSSAVFTFELDSDRCFRLCYYFNMFNISDDATNKNENKWWVDNLHWRDFINVQRSFFQTHLRENDITLQFIIKPCCFCMSTWFRHMFQIMPLFSNPNLCTPPSVITIPL